jgi:uncharacterized membrane protein
MSALAITLVISSAIMHAMRDFFTKKSCDTRSFMWAFSICSVILYLPVFLYLVSTHGWPAGKGFHIAITAGLVVHFLYWAFLTKAYEQGDLSHVYPIVRSAPALVLVASIFILKEEFSSLGIIGILLVVIGAYIINMKKWSVHSFLEPIESFIYDQTTRFALVALVMVTAYSLIDSQGVKYIHPIIYLYLVNFFSMIPYTIYVLSTRSVATLLNEWKCGKTSIVVNGFFGLMSYGFILIAFTMAQASYVVGLRQISIVLAVLLGGHMLKEKHKSIRLTSALIIFTGAFMISIA